MNDNSNNAYYVYGFTQAGLVPESVVAPPHEAGVSPGIPPHREASAESDNAMGVAPQEAGIVKNGEQATRMIPSGGIDELQAPFFQSFGKVAAILNLVSQAEFCGPAGETNLQDLAWLAPRACRHQAVIEQVTSRGLTSVSESWSSPSLAMTPGRKLSTSTSAPRTRSTATARPSGRSSRMPSERLPQFSAAK